MPRPRAAAAKPRHRRTAPRAAAGVDRARLLRQIDRIALRWPRAAGWLRRLHCHNCALLRIPLAALLILGGLFSVLPVLGLWMLPLGLVLLALDVPRLQRPVAAALIRFRRWRRGRRRPS